MACKASERRINYYVVKFGQKMKGSTLSTAKGWVNSIGTLTKRERMILYRRIKRKYYNR